MAILRPSFSALPRLMNTSGDNETEFDPPALRHGRVTTGRRHKESAYDVMRTRLGEPRDYVPTNALVHRSATFSVGTSDLTQTSVTLECSFFRGRNAARHSGIAAEIGRTRRDVESYTSHLTSPPGMLDALFPQALILTADLKVEKGQTFARRARGDYV
jgi:hypothetical protein